MWMMSLQLLATALILAVGALALRVWRREPPGHRRAVWLLAGAVWSAHGLIQAGQNLWGIGAMAAGAASGVMTGYLAWAPALNHSRTLLWMAACVVLVWLAFARAAPGRRTGLIAAVCLAAGAAAGFAVGRFEGPLVPLGHYTNVAVLDAVELVVLLGTLFLTVLTDRVDRYLWAGLLVWALTVAINVLWFAALSLVEDARTWSPSPIVMGIYRAVLLTLLASVFARRERLARLGRTVPGILAPRRPVGTISD